MVAPVGELFHDRLPAVCAGTAVFLTVFRAPNGGWRPTLRRPGSRAEPSVQSDGGKRREGVGRLLLRRGPGAGAGPGVGVASALRVLLWRRPLVFPAALGNLVPNLLSPSFLAASKFAASNTAASLVLLPLFETPASFAFLQATWGAFCVAVELCGNLRGKEAE